MNKIKIQSKIPKIVFYCNKSFLHYGMHLGPDAIDSTNFYVAFRNAFFENLSFFVTKFGNKKILTEC